MQALGLIRILNKQNLVDIYLFFVKSECKKMGEISCLQNIYFSTSGKCLACRTFISQLVGNVWFAVHLFLNK